MEIYNIAHKTRNYVKCLVFLFIIQRVRFSVKGAILVGCLTIIIIDLLLIASKYNEVIKIDVTGHTNIFKIFSVH